MRPTAFMPIELKKKAVLVMIFFKLFIVRMKISLMDEDLVFINAAGALDISFSDI
jgi:hypothetical protein